MPTLRQRPCPAKAGHVVGATVIITPPSDTYSPSACLSFAHPLVGAIQRARGQYDTGNTQKK